MLAVRLVEYSFPRGRRFGGLGPRLVFFVARGVMTGMRSQESGYRAGRGGQNKAGNGGLRGRWLQEN